jgi:hypothetical protein
MKRIVLLSDGTGNSAAKLFKTNVWRLYQSLDLSAQCGDGAIQIACYNDGVGTSAFKPLALLGGMFGYGLKRNVLHLYDFLCQTWEPGDEIFVFGFSRGAFTARILVGLIAHEGVLAGQDSVTRTYAIRDIYRRFRLKRYTVDTVPWLVNVLRPVWSGLVRLRRRLSGQRNLSQLPLTPVDTIRFLGVWDTVAAYGSPIAELTRGIDKFVFPLSMPDRVLNPKVAAARHALALDDERDTFHPLIWDERDPEIAIRLKQVWFSGMHADVGGGYPDDALSFQPLAWMMSEAEKEGLQFVPHARQRFAPPPSFSAPIHDSRKGVAGYYRYQPRKLSAYLLPPDPTTMIMVDPQPAAQAFLGSIKLHHSVVDRIRSSSDYYAPIVVPEQFEVVLPNGTVAPGGEPAYGQAARVAGGASVWDDVWRKRVNYFAMVICSLAMATLPFWASGPDASPCEGWACALSPVIRGIGAFIPSFLQYWTDAFANHPGLTVLFVAVLAALLFRSSNLQDRIRDEMWKLWEPLRASQAEQAQALTPPARKPSWIERLRTSPTYQKTLRGIKWRSLPNLLGVGALGFIALCAATVVVPPIVQHAIAGAEADGRICGLGRADAAKDFHTDAICWSVPDPATAGAPYRVEAGKPYRVELTVKEPWLDDTIATGPDGYDSQRLPWPLGYVATPARRSTSGRWFQPFVTIEAPDGTRHVQPLEFHAEGASYEATLVPRISGTLLLWVNDAVFWWNGLSGRFYKNNHGTAAVSLVRLPEVP